MSPEAPPLPRVRVEGPSSPRYLRQVLVAEVGARGQAALASFEGESVAGPGAWSLAERVAERYLAGAGLPPAASRVACDPCAPGAAPLDLVRDAAAREVLAGARDALGVMLRALGRAPEPPEAAAGATGAALSPPDEAAR